MFNTAFNLQNSFAETYEIQMTLYLAVKLN